MDPEMQELKKLVQENMELTRDTNRIVHGIRRNARWSMLMRLVYWAVILGVAAGAYYLYVQPFVTQFENLYQTVQSGGAQAQTQANAVQAFFQNMEKTFQSYLPHSTAQ